MTARFWPAGTPVQLPRIFWAQSSIVSAATQVMFAVAVPLPLFVKLAIRGEGISFAPAGWKEVPSKNCARSK